MRTVTTSTSSNSRGAGCTWAPGGRVAADRTDELEAKVKAKEQYLKSLGGVEDLSMLRSVLVRTIASTGVADTDAEIRELLCFVEECLKLAARVQKRKAFIGRMRSQIAANEAHCRRPVGVCGEGTAD